jgi:hypothetical protein
MTAPTFFLLVDAIPHDLAHEVWAEGGLEGFAEPRPSVSVFPSLTEVAVPSLLREIFAERPPGYEVRYYHPPSGEVRGRPGDPESEIAVAPYRARPRGLLAQAAIYLLRARLAYAQVRWITHRFEQEGGPWLGYLSATDGVAHFSGRLELARAFRDIAASVNEVRREHQRRHGVLPGVVLCSDHGVAFGRLEHLAEQELGERLAHAGFRPGESGRDGVVLVSFGDVGAGVVYTDLARAPEVAEVTARAPGVDLAFARVEGGCLVFASREGLGRARIRWRGELYRYAPERDDPLAYAPVWSRLAQAGRLRDGWARDADLFEATWSHRYPDAPARVRRAMEDLVQYPAPVIFSMKDSCTYGPALTHAGARLFGGQTGTHGALSTEPSLGFAAVTEDQPDPWPGAAALRPEDVFRPWRDVVRAGSDVSAPHPTSPRSG